MFIVNYYSISIQAAGSSATSLTSTTSPSVPVFTVTPNMFNFITFVSISGEDFSTRWAGLFSLVMIINYNSFRLWCVSSASALFNQFHIIIGCRVGRHLPDITL